MTAISPATLATSTRSGLPRIPRRGWRGSSIPSAHRRATRVRVPWTSVGTATSIDRTGLSLRQGVTYYMNVRATNGIGMVSDVGSSDGMTIDNTPPGATTVTDDGAYTSDITQLHAVLDAIDAESGIAKYECAVGTTPGGTDIAPGRTSGPARTFTSPACSSGMASHTTSAPARPTARA